MSTVAFIWSPLRQPASRGLWLCGAVFLACHTLASLCALATGSASRGMASDIARRSCALAEAAALQAVGPVVVCCLDRLGAERATLADQVLVATMRGLLAPGETMRMSQCIAAR